MALHDDQDSALARAIRAVGSQTAFGALLGKRQSVVSGWLLRETPLPAEFVLKVEAATGISRHDLRPDIYPLELASGSSVSATAGEPLPVGRTTASTLAGSDPVPATPSQGDETAGSGEAAGSISCDHLDPAADTPPIGKAAA